MDIDSIEIVDDILSHHGKKGMKWGVRQHFSKTGRKERRDRIAKSSRFRPRNASGPQDITVRDKGKKLKTSGGKGHPAHADAVRARTIGQKGKKSGLKALSDKELQDYTKRLNLEGSVKRLNYQEKNPGKKFILTLLGQTGKNQATDVAGNVAGHQVKKHLTSRLIKVGAAAAA